MSTIVIGDIHGCVDELNRLLRMLNPRGGDTVIVLGDLVHKGPDGAAVIDRLIEFSKHRKLLKIMGNHDLLQLRYRNALRLHKSTGKKIRLSDSNLRKCIQENLEDRHWNFLEDSYISYQLDSWLLVHGGIPSNATDMRTVHYAEYAQMSAKKKGYWDKIMRVRYEEDGKLISPGARDPEVHEYWANLYDGRFGHVLFGHHPWIGPTPKAFNHATGLDLGCCFGGHLCAAVLDGTNISYLSIKAYKEYTPRVFTPEQ